MLFYKSSSGPGFYEGRLDGPSSLIKFSPSLSKKGYGGAFVSKTEKLPAERKELENSPGPGHYEPREQFSSSKAGCSVFTNGGEGRTPYELGPNTPGPADYNIPTTEPGASKLLAKKPSATFLSASKRDSFFKNYRFLEFIFC